MKWVLRRPVVAALGALFVVSLMLSCGVSLYAAYTGYQFADGSAWVEHTHIVLDRLSYLRSEIADAESGERGYLLTDRGSDLELYNQALTAGRKHLQELAELTRDNSQRQAGIAELTSLVDRRFAEMTRTIELHNGKVRDARGDDAALAALRAEAEMERIRVLINDMESQELSLLARRDDYRRTTIWPLYYLAFGVTGLAAVVVLAGLLWSALLGFKRRA